MRGSVKVKDKVQETEGKMQKAKGKGGPPLPQQREHRGAISPFDFCLLHFAFCLFF